LPELPGIIVQNRVGHRKNHWHPSRPPWLRSVTDVFSDLVEIGAQDKIRSVLVPDVIEGNLKVPTFHMTDFVHQAEDFRDTRWKSLDGRIRVLALFLNAIAAAKAVPVAAAVVLKEYYGLSGPQQKKLVSPYHIAFQEVTFNLALATANKALQSAKSADEFFKNRVNMVYARLRGFAGPAGELWNASKQVQSRGRELDEFLHCW
jgi:hypothetical protein